MHDHQPEMKHDVRVERGSVRVITPDGAQIQIEAGQTMSDLPHPHEIAALEDETIIVNMQHISDPSQFLTLGLTYEFDAPLTLPLE